MCGIAGKLVINGSSTVNPDLLQNMISIVNHRGPDECGFYIDDALGSSLFRAGGSTFRNLRSGCVFF